MGYEARQAGAQIVELKLGHRAAELAATGQKPVFPTDVVEALALGLSRSLDCFVPAKEAEAVVVSFVSELVERGWKFYQPVAAPRSLSN